MIHFYSNGKVFGCYIIVACILSVSDIANAYGNIRGIFSERGEIDYSFHSESCVKYGKEEQIFVTTIKLFTESGVYVTIVDYWGRILNSNYTDLIEKVTIDCNGRTECNSSYSGLRIPRPTLEDVPVDFINISFRCLLARIDNITVFNIGLDFGLKILKRWRWYYLVLRLQNNKKTHRHCKIDRDRSDGLINVKHVDFGPLPKCNKINSDSLHQCYGNMTIVSRDNKECNYTWQPPFTYKWIQCKAEDVDIDVHMSTGFVWMQVFGADSDIKLNCSGSNRYNDETSNSPTSDTTHSDTTQTLVTNVDTDTTHSDTTQTLVTNVDTDTTHSDTTQTLVTNVDGSNPNKPNAETDSGKFDYIYTIVIPASVAFLALLIAIVSIVYCVWRRRERKRNSNYEVPSKTHQDNHPYSVPCGASAEVPHANHPTDYLEVIHFDYGYLEPTVVNNQEQDVMYEEIGI